MTKDADSLVQAAEAYARTDTGNGERLGLIEQGMNTLPGVTVAGGAR